jgi:uncharacterized membrane protein YfcA
VLVALAAGACVGVAVGLAGGGGAVLAVPMLVYLLDQSVHAATTESLVIVVAASGAGALGHARHHAVCWRLAAAFAAAALPGSVVGTLANRAFPAELLLGAFAVLLLGVSVLSWRQGGGAAADRADCCPELDLRVVALAGFAIGSLTGLFGVGGGFAVVPALVLLLRVPIRRAIATSLVIVTVVSTAGLAEHLVVDADIAWDVALPFAAAAMVTAALGGTIARRIPQQVLVRGFAVLLAGLAAYLIVFVTLLGGPPNG